MTLIERLKLIPDFRKDINLKHNLVDVIFLALTAVLSGADGWMAIQEFGDNQLDWLRKHRQFKNGIPRRHCIAKIIKMVDTDVLIQALFGWINEQREASGKQVIALDGKTLRGAWKESSSQALHVVSAFDVHNGLALYQDSSNSKGHERDVAKRVLDALTLENAIVSLDALHCQANTMTTVVKRKGDFMIQLKANQSALFEHAKSRFAAHYDDAGLSTFSQTNSGHGRSEKRTVMHLEAALTPELSPKWPHINTLIEVASERTIRNQTRCSSRWFASSLPVDAEQAASIVRDHWAVENKLHWLLDVVFKEDGLKISDPDGAKHVALLNRACLNMLRQHSNKKESLASKRRKACWSGDFRSELLFG
jgi:predicted transposase YbfD/YdcC